ncbi:MAG: lytic murein transglycosylase [Alphaproteobacteria bacterium]|nr:lytic murein transglycosylase [Alphaproteobacteria bacterium]
MLSGPAYSAPARIEIRTDDVTRFYKVYDGAGGHPNATQLQRDYLDPGSEGLHHLLKVRNVNASLIAEALDKHPELYTNARTCLAALPRVRARLDIAFAKLVELYPEAKKPPVTILIGRGKPVAIAAPGAGVQIGLEAICSDMAAKFLGGDIDDRLVHVTAHEYIHVQQAPALADNEHLTVLERSLVEGVAEFMAEMISGDISNVAVRASAQGHELAIETKFAADLDKTDLSDWVDNTTPDNVGQLGYWVGYRIAKSYYQKAKDKRAAIREMIELTDAHAFLAKSGWYPGIVLK